MQKTRIAVLRGGPSDSYHQSLESGAHILRSLPSHFEGLDIFIDKSGVWHERGAPVEPENVLKKVDVAWNSLHGSYGADGSVQNLIRHFGVPFTGPDAISAAVSWNAPLRNDIYAKAGLKTPFRKKISFDKGTEELALELFRSFPMPAHIVFSSDKYESIPAASFHALHDALLFAANTPSDSYIEQNISGKLAGCGVIEDFRGKKHYALLPFSISGESHDHPGKFSAAEKKTLESAALAAHTALGLRHYSMSYFIIHPKKGIHIVSTDSLPYFSRNSHFEESLKAVGANLPHFIGHVITLASGKK